MRQDRGVPCWWYSYAHSTVNSVAAAALQHRQHPWWRRRREREMKKTTKEAWASTFTSHRARAVTKKVAETAPPPLNAAIRSSLQFGKTSERPESPRVIHGSILCDPIQPNPSADWPNRTQPNPLQVKKFGPKPTRPNTTNKFNCLMQPNQILPNRALNALT